MCFKSRLNIGFHQHILPEAGWDDCTAMWDDDGKAYFIGTNFADGYKTYLFDMSPDARSIDRRSARLINEGNRREASKIISLHITGRETGADG